MLRSYPSSPDFVTVKFTKLTNAAEFGGTSIAGSLVQRNNLKFSL